MFDPNANLPDPSENTVRDNGTVLTEPGLYLVAFIYFAGRKYTTKNELPYLNMKAMVIAGPRRGEYWWEKVFTHTNAYKRLGQLCASMRWKTPFDLESDDDVKRVLVGRPFKARIAVSSGADGRQYAEIKFSETDFTGGEVSTMDTWRKAWEQVAVERANRASSGTSGGAPVDTSPFPGDDDIPF